MTPQWRSRRSPLPATRSVGAMRSCERVPSWWQPATGLLRNTLVHAADNTRGVDPQLRKVAITMARSTGKAFFANFSAYDAPFPTRTRLALANNWRKLRSRSGCCGNYGQPGC